jgi:hypothetical protein
MLAAQLFGTTGVAILLVLAAGTECPPCATWRSSSRCWRPVNAVVFVRGRDERDRVQQTVTILDWGGRPLLAGSVLLPRRNAGRAALPVTRTAVCTRSPRPTTSAWACSPPGWRSRPGRCCRALKLADHLAARAARQRDNRLPDRPVRAAIQSRWTDGRCLTLAFDSTCSCAGARGGGVEGAHQPDDCSVGSSSSSPSVCSCRWRGRGSPPRTSRWRRRRSAPADRCAPAGRRPTGSAAGTAAEGRRRSMPRPSALAAAAAATLVRRSCSSPLSRCPRRRAGCPEGCRGNGPERREHPVTAVLLGVPCVGHASWSRRAAAGGAGRAIAPRAVTPERAASSDRSRCRCSG